MSLESCEVNKPNKPEIGYGYIEAGAVCGCGLCPMQLYAVKVARTVWIRAKGGDYIKTLPIAINLGIELVGVVKNHLDRIFFCIYEYFII